MFCPNCGAAVDNGLAFCPNCGASMNEGEGVRNGGQPAFGVPFAPVAGYGSAAAPYAPSAPKTSGAVKGIIIGAVVLVAVASAIVLAVMLIPKGYEKPIKAAFAALEECDFDAILDTCPKGLKEAYIEECEDEEELEEEIGFLNDMLSERMEDEFGNDIKITYKIIDSNKLDEDDIEDLFKEYDDLDLDYDEKDIEAAYELDIEATITGDDDDDTEEYKNIAVIKMDGKWYLDFMTFYDSLGI